MTDTSQITEHLLDELAKRVASQIIDQLPVLARNREIPDELLDEPAMANRLKVSQQTLQRMRTAGEVPCIRMGRRVLYRPVDVLEALSQEKGGAE